MSVTLPTRRPLPPWGGEPTIREILEGCKDGEWWLVRTYPKQSTASTIVHQHKPGGSKANRVPPGKWEFAARKVGPREYGFWARYLGPEEA